MNTKKLITATAAALGAIAGTATALYAVGSRLFFSLAFERKPLIKMGGGVDPESYGEMVKKGQEWLHENDSDVRERLASDGTQLYCHYFPAANAKCTLIEFHGWRGAWDLDFSASSPYLNRMGYNLLLVEQRGQGRCGGSCMTFGLQERFDVKEWVEWYRENYDAQIPIILAGVSMGATTVLMASCQEFPPQVKGILADCGFNSPYDIIKHVGKSNYHMPEHPACDTMNLFLRLKTGLGLKDFTAAEAVAQAKLPILFIHGSKDTFVPPAMSEEIYEACASRKKRWLAEGAVHANSFVIQKDEYIRIVEEFFAEELD